MNVLICGHFRESPGYGPVVGRWLVEVGCRPRTTARGIFRLTQACTGCSPPGSPVVDPFDLPKPSVRKENKLVGAFVLYRTEVRPFTEKQIELVQNFAAQA